MKVQPQPSTNQEEPQVSKNRGRSSKSFTALSERAKRRKTEEFRSCIDSERLYFATTSKLFAEEKRAAAAALVKQATRYSPSRPVKLRQIIETQTLLYLTLMMKLLHVS